VDLVAHGAVVADLAHDGVEEDHRIDSVERPGLPVLDLAQHGVGDPADQIRGHVHLVDLAQVRLDVPHGHASGVGADQQFVDAVQAPLALAHDPRFEGAGAISGHVKIDRPGLGDQPLRRGPVPGVPGAGPVMGRVTEMVRELFAQHPLGRLALDIV
jgi:hypothetical protein